MSDNRTAPNTVFISLLAGLTGAAVALLLAPRSGEETRDKLHDKAEDIRDRANRNLRSATTAVNQKTQSAREFGDRVSQAITNTRHKAKEEIDELKSSRHDTQPSMEETELSNWEGERYK